MIKVGITGGIGSGKTTFCKEWEKLGAFVIYADDFAKQLMQEDEGLREKIKKVFGKQSYDEKGNLNKPFLAKEAFEKDRVEELNALVHPVLHKRVEELAAQKENEGVDVFAEEAAILLNNGRPDLLDYVILILAEENLRLQRTADRDQTSKDKILERMRKQPDFEALVHLADFVIVNDDSVEELKKKAQETLKSIKQIV